MIARKYETIVGIFVVGSLVALLFMILVIAQQEGLWENYIEYRTVFGNVSGLKKGSEVRLGGVTVGTVQGTVLRPDGKVLVTFEVLEKYKDQVRNDAQATIGMIGLLGDRSLDIIGGKADKPQDPKKLMASKDPVDIIDFVTQAIPSPEKLQKVVDNLEKITNDLADPKGNLRMAITNAKEVVEKINQGKGTLGMLVNDPSLYREVNQAAANVRKVGDTLNKKTVADLNVFLANLRKGSAPMAEAAGKLPGIMSNVETIVKNLAQASAGLPDLVITGQEMLGDAEKVAEAVLKSWFLRWAVPKSRERSIRIERDIK